MKLKFCSIAGCACVTLWFPATAAAAAGPRTQSFSSGAYTTIHYVSQSSGADDSDGSRSHPWRTLGHALDATTAGANARAAILVAAGTYAGTTISMKPYVDLLGGFDAASWKRDIQEHVTVLDGEGKRRVLLGADHARLDGFVITNGRVRGKGAGLLADGVSPQISNNVFVENMTLAPVPWKPDKMHETANDGGGIAVLRDGAPEISHNLFLRNHTEAGRGGGIACERSSPRIESNVFLDNQTGMADPARSSDGGAISIFDHSNPLVADNLLVGNRTAASNDGGGIFAALWSAPRIRGNTIVGSWGDDDGGALFIGGQQHHYGTPLDPIPPETQYLVRIDRNLIVGNDNKSHNAGAGRITMQARAELSGNVMAENTGGLKIETSGALLEDNRVAGALTITNTSKASHVLPGPVTLVRDAVGGPIDLQMPAGFRQSCGPGLPDGDANVATAPEFVDDAINAQIASGRQDETKTTTTLTIAGGHFAADTLAGRVVHAGDTWTIIKSNGSGTIQVWGPVNASATTLQVLPSYRLRPGTACAKAVQRAAVQR